MRTILACLMLALLTGCGSENRTADPNAPNFGTASVAVVTRVPHAYTVMPNLEIEINIGGQRTFQACATNWHSYDCITAAKANVHVGDKVSVKVYKPFCIFWNCDVVEQSFTVTQALEPQSTTFTTDDVVTNLTWRVVKE